MGILLTIATGIVGAVNPVAGLALKGVSMVKRAASKMSPRAWLTLAGIAALAAVVIYILILHGEIRHRDKTIAGNAALISNVKKEVDRGVGKPTPAADAPTYIRGFVDNLATVTAALDRQSKALNAAKADAQAHTDAAHQAAQPTPAQGQREKVRQAIVDPARTTGLSVDEWGKL